MNLTGFALRNQPLIMMIVGVLVIFGVSVLGDFPSQEDPPITVREAVVTTFMPGMEADEIELLVTRTIEQALARIPERDHVFSWSRDGKSVVHIEVRDEFEQDDLDIIWQKVRNEVIDATPLLPEGVIGPFVNDDFGDVVVVSAALTAEGFSLAESYKIAKMIRDQLYLISGVKRVTLHGVQPETVWIEFSTARIAQLGFSASTIREALVSQNVVLPGGVIDTGQREIIVVPDGDFASVEDIENTPIEIPGSGEVIHLRDLATVRRGYVDPPDPSFFYDGEQSILIAVSMAEGRNILDVGPRIVERLEQIEQKLPIGYQIRIGNYQPTHVERAVAAVRSNLFQTIGIVLVVIVIFLGFRTGIIVGLHVPLTMIVTLVVMYVMGIAMHRISLATLIISLGLLVDNGIVVAEEIGKRLSQGESRTDAATNTGKTLSTPLLISSITTVLMFMPLALAPVAAGEYLRSMSIVILISLTVSWLLAMTVTPILCSRFLKAPPAEEAESAGAEPKGLYAKYGSTLRAFLRVRSIVLAATLGVLIFGLWVFSMVPQQFMPNSDRPQILVNLKLPNGYGIKESERRIRALTDWLEDESVNPEITQTLTYVGMGGVRFFITIAPEPSASNMGFILITVEDVSAVESVLERVRTFAQENCPEMNVMAKKMFLGSTETGLVEARLSTLGLQGQRDKLMEAGKEVERIFSSVPHTVNIYNDFENRIANAMVEIDQTRASRAGVTNEEIAASLSAVLDGSTATVLREGDEEIPITGRARASERLSADRIFTANVFSRSTGAAVPLVQIATIRPQITFGLISRRDHAPTLTIQANSVVLTATELEAAVQDQINQLMDDLGPGFTWEWGGETEGQTEAQQGIFTFLPLALLGMLVCLVGQFNSIRKPIVILLTVPVAFTGVAIGLLGANGYFSFMALLGMLALVGIVVNNAIVMLEQIDLERKGGLDHYAAIIKACIARMRPIVMTALTTILGMLPIIISRDALFYDMAVTIASGLAFATLLTLGLAPVLYAVIMRVPSPKGAKT